MILASQPKPSSCVLRMMAAVKYFLQCWALRPMTRIALICIWTFRTERIRSANKPAKTMPGMSGNLRKMGAYREAILIVQR